MLKHIALLLVCAGAACAPSDRLDVVLENGWVVTGRVIRVSERMSG